MKYFFFVLICLPISIMAQNASVSKDTLLRNQNHYLIKEDGSKYLFTHEQWLKMTDCERAELIKEALKHKGYY
jgi:membrane-associated PAP2 superfamily phosphatase